MRSLVRSSMRTAPPLPCAGAAGGEGVAGHARAPRQRVPALGEGVRDDGDGRDAELLEDDPVGHTGRAAGASIAYGGNHHVAARGQLLRLLHGHRPPEVRLPFADDLLDGVALLQQLADGVEEAVGVVLRAVEQADRLAVEGAELAWGDGARGSRRGARWGRGR